MATQHLVPGRDIKGRCLLSHTAHKLPTFPVNSRLGFLKEVGLASLTGVLLLFPRIQGRDRQRALAPHPTTQAGRARGPAKTRTQIVEKKSPPTKPIFL